MYTRSVMCTSSSKRVRLRGLTLVELLIAVVLVSVLAGATFAVLRFFFHRGGKASLTTATERSFAQKDLRTGLRMLVIRLRESTAVLSPDPGFDGDSLEFLDVVNDRVRIRLEGDRVISERRVSETWQRETAPRSIPLDGDAQLNVSHPIRIPGCSSLRFTVLSPSCVVVALTLGTGPSQASLLTAVHLRNGALALRGPRL